MLYAGFSAGGLAAYLAAGSDPRASAYLGLDAVDSGGLALARNADFRVPALFLMGEPSSCNAKNNGHFLDPYDPRTESVCGKVLPPEAAAR